ncbi:MAG: protoporphyrinogen oxidase [Polyangiaceae bacterium]|nr:protoporphyrinogen oxidase [Polyangiaceae bacterium]
MKRVVVVGAGLSGLSAGVTLHGRAGLEVLVLDAATRAGGAVGTERIDGFLVERGADGFLTEKPGALELAARLGVAGRVIRPTPARDGAYVVRDGALRPLPRGFSIMAPVDLGAFLRSDVLSVAGRLRAAAEVLAPRRCPEDDESLASFVRRRFGSELLDRLAQPLAAGIYGADPERLSLRATMPRFLHEERRMGSVTLGLRERARARGVEARGARYQLFASFDGGLQVLVDAAAARLGDRLRLGAEVTRLAPRDDGVTLEVAGERVVADAVVLALPGPRLARLLGPCDPDLGARVGAVPHGSCATVTLGWDAPAIDPRLDGYGFVVPRVEGRPSMAATFLSKKWAGRAPTGAELARVFLPGEPASDDDAVAVARRELAALAGVTRAPVLARVQRHTRAMPVYEVGHVGRAREIERAARARAPRVLLAGNSLGGVGIPDSIAAGEAAAREAEARIAGGSAERR